MSIQIALSSLSARQSGAAAAACRGDAGPHAAAAARSVACCRGVPSHVSVGRSDDQEEDDGQDRERRDGDGDGGHPRALLPGEAGTGLQAEDDRGDAHGRSGEAGDSRDVPGDRDSRDREQREREGKSGARRSAGGDVYCGSGGVRGHASSCWLASLPPT